MSLHALDPVRIRAKMRLCNCWSASVQGGAIYVSGSANQMPRDVIKAFEEAIVEAGGGARSAAQQFLRDMELSGRYQVEAY